MINQITLENIANIVIIIAMICVIFKAFRQPLSCFFMRINPFKFNSKINDIFERIDDITLYNYELKQDIIEITKRIEKITKEIATKKK